jgi:hypothetical protein
MAINAISRSRGSRLDNTGLLRVYADREASDRLDKRSVSKYHRMSAPDPTTAAAIVKVLCDTAACVVMVSSLAGWLPPSSITASASIRGRLRPCRAGGLAAQGIRGVAGIVRGAMPRRWRNWIPVRPLNRFQIDQPLQIRFKSNAALCCHGQTRPLLIDCSHCRCFVACHRSASIPDQP